MESVKPYVSKAQQDVLRGLNNGEEIALNQGHYVTMKDGQVIKKLWPQTFGRLFDRELIRRNENGNYIISDKGMECWNGI